MSLNVHLARNKSSKNQGSGWHFITISNLANQEKKLQPNGKQTMEKE